MAAALMVTDEPSGVRVLTLSNPARRNALDAVVLEQLREAVRAPPPSVRAFLVRAEGTGVFSAGYDLHALAAREPGQPLPDEHVAEVLDALSRHALPSVGLITGPAFGAGCELAMACDLRVGDGQARFCMPPVKWGLVYSLAGFKRLQDCVGPSAARFLFLSGRPVDAERALHLGLLHLLEPTGQAERVAEALAAQLAASSPIAIEGTKAGLALAGDSAATSDALAHFERLHHASFDDQDARGRLKAALIKP